MTEDQARAAIIANGYAVVREKDRAVEVADYGRGKRSPARYFAGVSWLDLAQTFRLHKRPAHAAAQAHV